MTNIEEKDDDDDTKDDEEVLKIEFPRILINEDEYVMTPVSKALVVFKEIICQDAKFTSKKILEQFYSLILLFILGEVGDS